MPGNQMDLIMVLKLGCIADDITGASDVALMLAEHGMPVLLSLGLPDEVIEAQAEAIVIGLKSRTIKAEQAVKQSIRAARWLLQKGATQLLFKYCSTFDSTQEGNIGPVAEALLDLTGDDFTLVCPAFPDNGRTIENSLLMVGGIPLSESSMRDHPLTPMRNSNLVELMDQQTQNGSTTGLSRSILHQGAKATREKLSQLRNDGFRYVVPDVLNNDDLKVLAKAASDLKVITGASGIAMGLPHNFGPSNPQNPNACAPLPTLKGHPVIIAGSCSKATRSQVEFMRGQCFTMEINPIEIANQQQSLNHLCETAISQWRSGPILIYSSTNTENVKLAQEQLGKEQAATLVEQTLAQIAVHLVSHGACKFVLAGGETSGAIAAALGASLMHIGPKIDSGVPWMIRADGPIQVLAFKSGNFGTTDFFQRAIRMLP
jgi:uncharacterized protein YgbK (DUF1537 family)